ncbi:hypothetical protein [Tenacibaculum xiamenense]|uniref:hypothetical protein n=1 Tax=Tenacibaculum xiamenense TaxID=1261553 RepID=UPI003893CD21
MNKYNLSSFEILVIILVAIVGNSLLLKSFVITDEVIYNFYYESFTEKRITEFLENKNKLTLLGYLIMPLVILIRSGLVAICLSVGVFFYNTENKLKFKQFFRVALVGEFVLVLVGFVKLLYFLIIKTDYTLKDIQQYYPLSYINFLDINNLEPWLIYPLQTINLFEVAYFLVLVYGLHKLLKKNYWKSFEITAASYGTGLVIWIGVVMFLTLNMS